MKIGIYGIFDAVEEDVCLYVGQSRNIEDRWKGHLKKLRNVSHLDDFNEWYADHSSREDALKFKVLETCVLNDLLLNQLEIKWFNALNPLFYGKVPSENERWTHSLESRKRISEGLKFSRRQSPTECANSMCEIVFVPALKRNRFCSKKCSLESSSKASALTASVLEELYSEQKLTMGKIAEIYGVSRVAVMKRMRKYGIASRKPHVNN